MIPSAANPRHSGVASARSTAPVNSQVHTNGYNCDVSTYGIIHNDFTNH